MNYHSSYYGESYWYYTDANSNEVKVTQGGSTKIYTRTSDGTKMAALQKAAKAFVSNVEQKNPDSRISIVSFSGSASIKKSNKKYLLRVGDSKTKIDSWIDELDADGATNTADGLKKAKEVFSSSEKWADVNQTDGRKKMVVFLTDGVPTTHSDYSDTVASNAVTHASDIKRDYEADIYSLGIFDAAGSNGKLSGASIAKINKFMTDVASDASKYMTADGIESLYNIFNSITENMPNSVTATITDVIDSRFELTTVEKDRLKGRGATVTENPDKTTTVTWTNTTVNSKTGDTLGWHETIEIKAKDDFIGGNMIPTNGSASGITVGENTKYFPQPSVNVKLLDSSLGSKEITVYKSHTIKSSDFPSELENLYKFTELDDKTELKPGEAGIPTLTEFTAAELTELKAGKPVEKDYTYPGTNDKVGSFKYEYKPVTNGIKTVGANGNVLSTADAMKNHPATTVGNAVEKYELTVTFVPSTVDKRKQLLSNVTEPDTTKIKDANGIDTDMPKGGLVVNSVTKNGSYTVNVWSLEKISSSSTTVNGNEVHPKLEGAIFKLQGTKLNDAGNRIGVTYYGKSNAYGFVEWYTTYIPDTHEVSNKVDVDTGIAPDTYKLTELVAPAGYALNNQTWTIRTDGKTCSINGNATDVALNAAYENTPVYALPSTGGRGIFLYMIGGMLLMGGAAWILYKNKRREVLKR